MEDLKRYALELGLDTAPFDECVDARKHREAVERDYMQGGQLGVNATPTFLINGRLLSGAQPFDAFRTIIEDEIAK